MPKRRTTTKSEPIVFETGSGNVYADIGLPNPELYQAKAHFVRALQTLIDERRLSDAKAATLLKIEPEKLETLLRGQTKRFTIDRLVRMVQSLGHTVEIVITPSRSNDESIRVK